MRTRSKRNNKQSVTLYSVSKEAWTWKPIKIAQRVYREEGEQDEKVLSNFLRKTFSISNTKTCLVNYSNYLKSFFFLTQMWKK